MLISFLSFQFVNPEFTKAEVRNESILYTIESPTIEEESFFSSVKEWTDSILENVDDALDSIKEAFNTIVSYMDNLADDVTNAIAVFTGDEQESDSESSNINNTIDEAKDTVAEMDRELDKNVVYRVLREDENPKNGIFAKAPEREHITIAGHVNNGSKKNFKGSKYISTTKSFDVAYKNATTDIMNGGKEQDLRIIQIDLEKVTNKYYDLTDPATQDKYLVNSKGEPWEKVRRYANASKELLIEYEIEPDAIEVLGRPSELKNNDKL